MMLTINSASFNRRAYEEFDELEFAQSVNYGHARLIWAASIGNLESLKAQLHSHSMVPDRIKTLALHQTIALWKYDCCQLLLDDGADPNGIGIDGLTPLTRAASELEIDIAALLQSYGARTDLADRSGHTPLYCACQDGVSTPSEDSQKRLKMVVLLLGRDSVKNHSLSYLS